MADPLRHRQTKGGNRYGRPNTTAPHPDSTTCAVRRPRREGLLGAPQTQAAVTYALTDLFKEFSASTGVIEVYDVNNRPKFQATCFFVTKDGYALATANLFDEGGGRPSGPITVSIGSP